MAMEPLEAYTAFEGRLLRRVSTRAVPFQWGTAYLDDDRPQRYYSNFLRTETDLTGVSADDLIAAADEILGDDRYEHRLVIVRDEAAAERLGAGFAAAGFSREPEVVQMLRRDPDRPGAIDVDVMSFADARELILQTHLEDERLPDAMAGPFTDARAKYERAIGAQFFVARIDGEDAQVENVGTILRFRNRGVARSVVLAACEAAKAAGASRIFILADDQDWPKQLYQRLGFDRLATDVGFLRSPATTP